MAPFRNAFLQSSRRRKLHVWTRPSALDTEVRICHDRRAETIRPSDAGHPADHHPERPGAGRAAYDGSFHRFTPPASEAIESIKEAERVSIAAPYEQPISQAPTNVYVVRRSAAG